MRGVTGVLQAAEPVARSLTAHMELVELLLHLDLSDVEPALRFDPLAYG